MKTRTLLRSCTLILALSAMYQFTSAQSWILTGNSGSNPKVNYLGTNDKEPLIFKIYNDSLVGDLDSTNTFLGWNAGQHNYNTLLGGGAASGFSSQGSPYSGEYNTLIGGGADRYLTNGYENTAVGSGSLNRNTSGFYNNASGVFSLNTNSTGYSNNAYGFAALNGNVNGNDNTAMGNLALFATHNSTGNTALGANAGFRRQNGDFNTFVGYGTIANDNGYTNSSCLGNASTITASNQVRIGNATVTSIGGYVNWSNIGDGRYKKNVKQNVPGIEFIKQLVPVTYTLDIQGINHLQPEENSFTLPNGKTISLAAEDQTGVSEKEKVVYSGFIAQDVEAAAKKSGYDFSGVDAPKNDKDLYGLRYADFVVPLVKAVQELDAENSDLKTQLSGQQTEIDQLKATVQSLVSSSTENSKAASDGPISAHLDQNLPNPFSNITTISYSLPQHSGNAMIRITDVNGSMLKEFDVTNSTQGQVVIHAGEFAAGTYFYSLYMNGEKIDTKQMVLTK